MSLPEMRGFASGLEMSAWMVSQTSGGLGGRVEAVEDNLHRNDSRRADEPRRVGEALGVSPAAKA